MVKALELCYHLDTLILRAASRQMTEKEVLELLLWYSLNKDMIRADIERTD